MDRTHRIDFISAYCDRWCERCAFTDRCSSFACALAIGMCGDVAAGIELAVGVPELAEGTRPETAGERQLADFVEPSAEEMAEILRKEAARDKRLTQHPLARSDAAWQVIAAATSESGARILADAIAHLCRTMLDEFPSALSFIWPGFDEQE